jgi:hypothetical protein
MRPARLGFAPPGESRTPTHDSARRSAFARPRARSRAPARLRGGRGPVARSNRDRPRAGRAGPRASGRHGHVCRNRSVARDAHRRDRTVRHDGTRSGDLRDPGRFARAPFRAAPVSCPDPGAAVVPRHHAGRGGSRGVGGRPDRRPAHGHGCRRASPLPAAAVAPAGARAVLRPAHGFATPGAGGDGAGTARRGGRQLLRFAGPRSGLDPPAPRRERAGRPRRVRRRTSPVHRWRAGRVQPYRRRERVRRQPVLHRLRRSSDPGGRMGG